MRICVRRPPPREGDPKTPPATPWARVAGVRWGLNEGKETQKLPQPPLGQGWLVSAGALMRGRRTQKLPQPPLGQGWLVSAGALMRGRRNPKTPPATPWARVAGVPGESTRKDTRKQEAHKEGTKKQQQQHNNNSTNSTTSNNSNNSRTSTTSTVRPVSQQQHQGSMKGR